MKCKPCSSRNSFITFQERLLLVCALLLSAAAHAQMTPRRVAILSFDLGQVAGQMAHQSMGIQGDLGRDLSEQLTSRLASSGKVTLVERGRLESILKEQNISNSDRFDPADAAKIGKIAGVDSVVIGTVTQLAGSVRPTATGTACTVSKIFIKSTCKQQRMDVSLEMSVRVIEVNTGAITTTATAKGTGTETKTGAEIQANGQSYDTTKATEFGNGPLGQAISMALNDVVKQLVTSPALAALPAPPRGPYSGEIVDVSGNTIIFMVGKVAGARVGDVVAVTHQGRVIRDRNGTPVKTIIEAIGTAKVTEVDDKTSTATFAASSDKKPKNADLIAYKP